MFKVHEVHKLNNGMPVLVCDLFEDSDITESLFTDIGIFSRKEFEVGPLRFCFSSPKTRTIMLRTMKDCTGIKMVNFI